MRAFINCVGRTDSLGSSRMKEIRGLVNFGGKPVVAHTLERLAELKLTAPTLLYVNEEHLPSFQKEISGYNVEIMSAEGHPLLVYANALEKMNDHSLLISDDNLFDFSLIGLVSKFKEVDDNVLAARELSKIVLAVDSEDLNFGTCDIDTAGKICAASHSFDSRTKLDSEIVVFDIYLVHQKRIDFYLTLAKAGNIPLLARSWYQNFHAWMPQGGFWADIGKPPLRRLAEEHYKQRR